MEAALMELLKSAPGIAIAGLCAWWMYQLLSNHLAHLTEAIDKIGDQIESLAPEMKKATSAMILMYKEIKEMGKVNASKK